MLDEETQLPYAGEGEQDHCYFNNATYDLGGFIISGNGDLLRCYNGVWVKEN
jgi:hypothetical protein